MWPNRHNSNQSPVNLRQLEDRILMSAAPAPELIDAGVENGSWDDAELIAAVDSQLDFLQQAFESELALDEVDAMSLAAETDDGFALGMDDTSALDGWSLDTDTSDGPPTLPAVELQTGASALDAATLVSNWSSDTPGLREVVFIDAAADEDLELMSDLLDQQAAGRDIEVFLLDPELDGIEQIRQVLAEFDHLDAVHLVTHGADGQIQLGNATLSNATWSEYAVQLAAWGDALQHDGDLLIYGCDVAATEDGRSLLELLRDVCDCDIAASDDRTGAVELGGDWDLEYNLGAIQSSVVFSADVQAEWGGVLATYLVTNTNDSGAGSLRDAIDQANASAGADVVTFNISGSGTQVISLASALPQITEQLTIDGTTQTGWVAGSFLPVVLDGNDVASGIEFSAAADGSLVRGLVIRDFNADAVDLLAGADNITIAGNWIGQFNSDGSDAGVGEANVFSGVRILGDNAAIGGSAVADRNVIAGTEFGVLLRGTATGNTVSGNYIGTDVAGGSLRGAIDYGVYMIENAAGNVIGGAVSADGNVIAGAAVDGIHLWGEGVDGNTIQNNYVGVSADGAVNLGNAGDGILIFEGGDNQQILNNLVASSGLVGIEVDGNGVTSSGNVIQGNTIGTDLTGVLDWGSGENGILLERSASDNVVGGVGAGDGNVVAFSGRNSSLDGSGIAVQDGSSATIRGNSVYSNRELGIDLSSGVDDGADANDAGDGDTGGNNRQNWAVLKTVAIDGAGQLSINLDTTTLVSGDYSLDLYASTSRDGGFVEGERFLGSVALSSADVGNSSLTLLLSSITLSPGEYVTLTATDIAGNTSEFSNYAVATDGDPGGSTPTVLTAVSTSSGGLSINEDGGDDTYLLAEDGAAIFGGATAFTAEFQLQLSDTGHMSLLGYTTDADGDEIYLAVDNGSMFLQIQSAVVISASAGAGIYDGQTHHLAFSWDNTGAYEFFVDGASLESGSGLAVGATLNTTGGTLVLGHDPDYGNDTYQFDANGAAHVTLHDVRIFDAVRSSADLAAYADATLPRDEPSMVANWRFGERLDDDVIADVVGGNGLTIEHAGGLTASTPELTLAVSNGAATGTVVGAVNGADPDRDALIASLLASDPDLLYSAETGKFYKAGSTTDGWAGSQATAIATTLNGVSGQLVTIRSAYEHQLVLAYQIEHFGAATMWLGAADIDVEGDWRWYDGAVAGDQFWAGAVAGANVNDAYVNWNVNDPNDNGPGEDGAQMYDNGLWLDIRLTANARHIVEWYADDVLDATQALTYSLASQTVAGAFAIDASTGQITVADGALIDYAANPSHTLTVQVTDADGNSTNQAFTIDIDNAGFPTDIVFDSDGGAEQVVNSYATSDQIDPTIAAFADGGHVVVWVSNGQDGSGYGIYGQRYLADGSKNGGEFLVTAESTDAETNPSVATFDDGGFVVAWQDQTSGVRAWTEARVFNSDGTAATAEFVVSPGVDGDNEGYQPTVEALNGNEFVVVWANEIGGATYEVAGQIYDRAGAAVGGQFTIGDLVSGTGLFGAQTEVTLLDDGGFAAVWRTHDGANKGTRARVMNADGTARSAELILGGDDIADIAALSTGGFVVTYDSSGALKAAIYDASGAVAIPEFTVNTTASAARYESTVARSDGGFVVAWESDSGDGAGSAILARRFDNSGVAVSDEVLFNSTTAGNQQKPELVETASGQLVAVWQSENVDGDLTAIVSRAVATGTASVDENAANGTRVAEVIGVVDADIGDTHTFSLTNDANGRFAIDSVTGIITVADGSRLDYESATSHDVTVAATDSLGNVYSEVLTIAIHDIAEANTAPYFVTVNTAATEVVESLSGATAVSSGDINNDGFV
ncbi:MAG: DUF4347 domain-containing protein, partial [Planctomycetales bacterium]|nr:DUF4347 domain-containing protein [Planctomycetales bacterium]